MRSSLLGLAIVFVITSSAAAQDTAARGGGTSGTSNTGGTNTGTAGTNGTGGSGTASTTTSTTSGTASPPPVVTAQGTAAPPQSAPAEATAPASPPPPAVAPPDQPPAPAPQQTDDGRDSDVLWLEASFGYSYADLAQFSNNNLLPTIDHFQGSGYAGGLAAGFRISFLMLGVRGALARYSAFDLGTAVLEAQLRIPLPTIPALCARGHRLRVGRARGPGYDERRGHHREGQHEGLRPRGHGRRRPRRLPRQGRGDRRRRRRGLPQPDAAARRHGLRQHGLQPHHGQPLPEGRCGRPTAPRPRPHFVPLLITGRGRGASGT